MDHSEIDQLRNQFEAGRWPKFIEKISINGLRSWNDKAIEFKFPVVAIVGENGTGKSTLLKAAACAYEGRSKQTKFFPTDFFIETQWEKIQNVRIDYSIKLGTTRTDIFYTKKSHRWRLNRKRPDNDVFLLEVSRTLPLDATAGYARIARLAASEISRNEITGNYKDRLSHILGKDYESASFALTEMDAKKEVGLLRRSFGEVSQYHQGAGEDTTLDLMRILQNIPDTSLLIIDEVEASLHPKSQRRLVQFLLWFARQKKCQIILSTHSPYVLQELPREARIMIMAGNEGINLVTGITPEFAMSKLDDADYPELDIFVEDRLGGIWLREIVVYLDGGDELIRRIRIGPVGPANVVQTMGSLGYDNKLPYKSLAFLDGDKDVTVGCAKLPGDKAPEYVIFEGLRAKSWAKLPERFGFGAGVLFEILEDAMRKPNHHEWIYYVGDKVRMSAVSVWEILCNEWVRNCLSDEEKEYISNEITAKLDAVN